MNMTIKTVMLLCLFGALIGCQSSQSVKAGVMDNAGFMDLWNTYSHCQASSDLDELTSDVVTLARADNDALAQESFVLPLPKKLEQFVSHPTTRFAVDVKAMAAACSIRAGQLASDAGHFDLAKDLFKTVLARSQTEDYRYYSSQAQVLLAELEARFVQVSQRLP
jgi:hypothetical protein